MAMQMSTIVAQLSTELWNITKEEATITRAGLNLRAEYNAVNRDEATRLADHVMASIRLLMQAHGVYLILAGVLILPAENVGPEDVTVTFTWMANTTTDKGILN